MTNRELLERVVGDLNDLINRGNDFMTPVRDMVAEELDRVNDLHTLISAMSRDDDDDPDLYYDYSEFDYED